MGEAQSHRRVDAWRSDHRTLPAPVAMGATQGAVSFLWMHMDGQRTVGNHGTRILTFSKRSALRPQRRGVRITCVYTCMFMCMTPGRAQRAQAQ
jgi:hypothetical protein